MMSSSFFGDHPQQAAVGVPTLEQNLGLAPHPKTHLYNGFTVHYPPNPSLPLHRRSHRHPLTHPRNWNSVAMLIRLTLQSLRRRSCCQAGAGRHRRSGAHGQHSTGLTLVSTR